MSAVLQIVTLGLALGFALIVFGLALYAVLSGFERVMTPINMAIHRRLDRLERCLSDVERRQRRTRGLRKVKTKRR